MAHFSFNKGPFDTKWGPCGDPESYDREGPTLTFYFFDEMRDNPNNTKSGPSLARQRNTI